MIFAGTSATPLAVLVIMAIGLLVVTLILMLAASILERRTKNVRKLLADMENRGGFVWVTRCKECSHCQPHYNNAAYLWCDRWAITMDGDHYCAEGRPRL